MKGATPLAAGVTSSRCLAVHRDDIGLTIAQGIDPVHEAGLEELTIERIDHVVKRIVGRKSPLVREKPPQEIQPLIPPQTYLDKIVHAAQRRAQHQQQNLRQGVNYPPALAWIR